MLVYQKESSSLAGSQYLPPVPLAVPPIGRPLVWRPVVSWSARYSCGMIPKVITFWTHLPPCPRFTATAVLWRGSRLSLFGNFSTFEISCGPMYAPITKRMPEVPSGHPVLFVHGCLVSAECVKVLCDRWSVIDDLNGGIQSQYESRIHGRYGSYEP